MSQTRREFLVTTTAVVAAAALSGAPLSGAPVSPPAGTGEDTDAPFLLEGDPYTAHVDECGLGARSWDEARDHALRFRSTPDDRDRYVLGLET